MREVEVKILEIDRETVIARLISLGARKAFDDEIHALYYDTRDSAIRQRGGVLRLRREGPRAVLAFKQDMEDQKAKVREEQEVGVSDFGGMRSILEAAGMSVWLEMRKHRTSYELDGVRFELDRYHGEHANIPEFLEIEGPSVDVVHRYAGMLGYRREDCLPWDAVQLSEHYAGRRARHS